LEESVAELQAKNATLEGQLTVITTTLMTAQEQEIGTLREELAEVQRRNDTLSDRLDEQDRTLEAVADQVGAMAAIQAEVVALQAELEMLRAEVAALGVVTATVPLTGTTE
jgi:chromosome segregation ATPase